MCAYYSPCATEIHMIINKLDRKAISIAGSVYTSQLLTRFSAPRLSHSSCVRTLRFAVARVLQDDRVTPDPCDEPVPKSGAEWQSFSSQPSNRSHLMTPATYPSTRLFINGQWQDAADGKTLAVFNPATGKKSAALRTPPRSTWTER